MNPSKNFLYFCLSFILGIFFNSFFKISLPVLLVFLILGLILISVFWKYKKLAVLGFCFIFLVFGIWRHYLAELKIFKSEVRELNKLNQEITLIGKVSTEPDIREKRQKLKIENCKLEINEKLQDISGAILITTNRYPQYQYGDNLKIRGKLEAPKEIEDFNYPGYLAKDGIYSIIYFPKIEIIEREKYDGFFSLLFSKILKIKNKLRESIYRNLSPPQSTILTSLILGDKKHLSEELKEKLNAVGLRHITAVSGLHVAVLTNILMTALIALGFWRQQAFYFTIILISFFVLMTGLQSSAIRAGLMGFFLLLAQHLGRQNASERTIVFACALMLFQNPLLLKFDIGFQLSFLAILGIIYFLPSFQDWLKFIKFKNARDILAMTFSSYLFTLPILIYNFGSFSLVSPLTNLLVLPILSWVMIFGFLAAILGVFSQVLGWIFSLPSWFLLTYIIKIINYFSSIPFGQVKIENFHWIFLLISYLILIILAFKLKEKQKLKFLNY